MCQRNDFNKACHDPAWRGASLSTITLPLIFVTIACRTPYGRRHEMVGCLDVEPRPFRAIQVLVVKAPTLHMDGNLVCSASVAIECTEERG